MSTRPRKQNSSQNDSQHLEDGFEQGSPELEEILRSEQFNQIYTKESGQSYTGHIAHEIMEEIQRIKGSEIAIEDALRMAEKLLPPNVTITGDDAYAAVSAVAQKSRERSEQTRAEQAAKKKSLNKLFNWLKVGAVIGIAAGTGFAAYQGNTLLWNQGIADKQQELETTIENYQGLMQELELEQDAAVTSAVNEAVQKIYEDRYGELASLSYSTSLDKAGAQGMYFSAEHYMEEINPEMEDLVEEMLISELTGTHTLSRTKTGTHTLEGNTLESYLVNGGNVVITSENAQGAKNFMHVYTTEGQSIASVQFTDNGFKTIDYQTDKMVIVEGGVKSYEGTVQQSERITSQSVFNEYTQIQSVNNN